MQEKHIGGLTVVVAIILTFSTFASIAEAKDPYQPKIDPSNFSRVVNNPYYPLRPRHHYDLQRERWRRNPEPDGDRDT